MQENADSAERHAGAAGSGTGRTAEARVRAGRRVRRDTGPGDSCGKGARGGTASGGAAGSSREPGGKGRRPRWREAPAGFGGRPVRRARLPVEATKQDERQRAAV